MDKPWLDLLQHIQRGDCTEEQLSMLHRLVLTHEECPPTDFPSAPCSDALLVTPRHAVRMKWNLMCAKARTQAHGQMLINCPALDTIQGQQLTMEERFAVAAKPKTGWGKNQREHAGLADEVGDWYGSNGEVQHLHGSRCCQWGPWTYSGHHPPVYYVLVQMA